MDELAMQLQMTHETIAQRLPVGLRNVREDKNFLRGRAQIQNPTGNGRVLRDTDDAIADEIIFAVEIVPFAFGVMTTPSAIRLFLSMMARSMTA